MAKLILYRPLTPGLRHAGVIRLDKKTVKTPKSLLSHKKSNAGRNNQGKITVRHQGSGVKNLYREIDFRRTQFDVPAKVVQIEYDPNRSAHIALLSYVNGVKSYIIAPDGLLVGQKIVSSLKAQPIILGNRLRLADIPSGQLVHAIELVPGKGAKLVRAAGNAAVLMNVEGDYAQVKLPSGETRLFPKDCMATVGQVGNSEHRAMRFGKAGRKRKKGIRPSVRGKVMNPVDHPHGGGEGNQPIGLRSPKNVWGKKAYGVKTRRPGKLSDKLIVERRKRKHLIG
ncbi:MAG: 50S ribosomal protein L2 [bacterium]